MKSTRSTTTIPFYRDERFLRTAAQIVSAILVIAFLIVIVVNFFRALDARNLSLSYDFLNVTAAFPISDPAIEYTPADTFGRAFLVGLLNTLRVSVLGILMATILGTMVALARLSSNWLLSRIALAYIEFHRNIPLLVLLFIWYFAVFSQLPSLENSIVFPGPSYLNQRGAFLSWPRLNENGWIFVAALLVALVVAITIWVNLRRKREDSGEETNFIRNSLLSFAIISVIGWFLAGGDPFWVDVPAFEGFNIQGGLRFTPEFLGLFVGLFTYTAAFIAEVVRAGIQAVDKGQLEAASAVGLSSFQVLSLVIIPQSLRIIIPPMISQYLNLTKNSSLALAIGFQELFSVGKIVINQAGLAVPVFILIMASYLLLSGITSFILNIYNRRIQFTTR
jgi:general L-amino acid transport system permease protein